MKTGEAMTFLKPMMVPLFPAWYPRETTAKSFDFFGLPVEIRNAIYDMLYTFPTGTPEVNGSPNIPTMITVYTRGQFCTNRIAAKGALHWAVQAYPDATNLVAHQLQPAPDTLASLVICHQFYQEALPSFFARNTFFCMCIESIKCMLETLAPSRRQLLTSIAFGYHPTKSEIKVARKLFAMLAELPRLRSLRIVIDEDDWAAETKMSSGRVVSHTQI